MGLISRELHITDVVLHKNFNFTAQLNDIALLKTSELQQQNSEDFSVSAMSGFTGQLSGERVSWSRRQVLWSHGSGTLGGWRMVS